MRLTRTLRGKVRPAGGSDTGKERIIVDDGVFTDGWRITGFDVFPTSVTGVTQGILSIDEDGLTGGWDAEDNRQIAWSYMFVSSDIADRGSFFLPDHVVVRDLWIQNFGSAAMNYIVRIERETLSDDQAILALIQERSQDDL